MFKIKNTPTIKDIIKEQEKRIKEERDLVEDLDKKIESKKKIIKNLITLLKELNQKNENILEKKNFDILYKLDKIFEDIEKQCEDINRLKKNNERSKEEKATALLLLVKNIKKEINKIDLNEVSIYVIEKSFEEFLNVWDSYKKDYAKFQERNMLVLDILNVTRGDIGEIYKTLCKLLGNKFIIFVCEKIADYILEENKNEKEKILKFLIKMEKINDRLNNNIAAKVYEDIGKYKIHINPKEIRQLVDNLIIFYEEHDKAIKEKRSKNICHKFDHIFAFGEGEKNIRILYFFRQDPLILGIIPSNDHREYTLRISYLRDIYSRFKEKIDKTNGKFLLRILGRQNK